MARTREEFIVEDLQRCTTAFDAAKAAFGKAFEINPASAIEWKSSGIAVAQETFVLASNVLELTEREENPLSLAKAIEAVRGRIVKDMTVRFYPHRSTNPYANELFIDANEARGKFVERCDSWLSVLEKEDA